MKRRLTLGSVAVWGLCLLLVLSAAPAWAAFPAMSGEVTGGDSSAATTDHVITLPATLVSGDGILVIISCRNGPTYTWPDGTWTSTGGTFDSASGNARTEARMRTSDGTEDGTTITVVTNVGGKCAWIAARVTGRDTGTAPERGGTSSGSSTAPNATTLDPAGWGTEDTLWVTIAAWPNAGITVSTYPYAANNNTGASTTSNSIAVGIASTNSATSSLDAAAWLLSLTTEWGAGTLAIRPSAAAAGGSTINCIISGAFIANGAC